MTKKERWRPIMNETILKADNISISFGGLKAVDSVSFEIQKGEIMGLIGPNGAGKTTIFNLITQFYKLDEGSICFLGNDLSKFKPHQIIEKGVARTFQNVELFKSMTVLENLLVGQHSEINYNIFQGVIRTKKVKEEEQIAIERAMEVLKILEIEDYAYFYAGHLPYGVQKLVELGRALVSGPKLIILDEPAAGMNDTETKEFAKKIQFVKEKFDLTILLIEHDMSLVMSICNTIMVLNFGKKIAEGTPKEISSNSEVIKAYLGEEV